MKKLINFIIAAAIGVAILYMISLVLASIVLVVMVIVNRIIAYRKKHRRFTEWEFQFSRLDRETIGDRMQFKRTYYYERFDRVLNITETHEDIKVTPIKDYDNIKAEEFAEWLINKNFEKRFIDQKVRSQMSGI